MKIIQYLLVAAIVAVFLFGCDTTGDETMSWKPGDNLHIIGESEILVDEENEYYVDAFTIKESYTWTIDGSPITPTRNGEFVTLVFDDPGTHTLQVSNGVYDGTLTIEVSEE